MKKFSYRVLTGFIIAQLLHGHLFATDYNQLMNRQINSGVGLTPRMSFRLGDNGTNVRGKDSLQMDDNLSLGGMMMTESSVSGLSYQIHVLGEVKNPGTYRITASDRLSEVINRAGGIDEQGSQRRIELRRKTEGVKKIDLLAFQVFGNLSNNPYLLDNDVVFIPLRGGTIQVVGAVMRPKDYELKDEKNLIDAVKLAGGFSVGAAINSPLRVVRFLEGKKEVLEVASNETDMQNFQLQNGDVIFVPHVITEKNTFDYDVPKLPGDNIFYPSFEDRVFILGGVAQPGPYSFNPYYSLPQYLSAAGGTTKMFTGKISVLSPDGKSKKIPQRIRDTVVINPGDTIVIGERRITPEGWMGLVMGLASFGLSTTATVLALTVDRR